MQRRRVLVLTLVAVSGAVLAAGASALSTQEMPQPSEHHALLTRSVGEWEGTLKMTMPGFPADPIPATERCEAIGGFWTQTRFESSFMGMPYIGTGVVGYDPAKKKYVGTWVDSMSSYLALMEGTMDPKTRTLTMHWQAPDMAGQMNQHRYEAVMKDDSYVSTFYMGEGDEEMQMMVIEMKKKAGKKGEKKGEKKGATTRTKGRR